MVYDNNGNRVFVEIELDEETGDVCPVTVVETVIAGITLNGQPVRYADWQ